ncbi:MAG: hypothetical protein QM770_06275 [Tepidisphaeraceae bacterium]
MTRRLLLVAAAVALLAPIVSAVPQIMPKPKAGKWVGDKVELQLVPVVQDNPTYDFTGKLTLKSKSYDIKMACDQVKGNWGTYEEKGEQKSFQFVVDNNTNEGTIKIQDPYAEYAVKWDKNKQ